MPVIGLDLGATRIKAGVVDRGRVLASHVVTLDPGDRSPTGIVARLAGAARDVAALGDVPWGRVDGIGIGAPGAIRASDGVITRAPNFPLWSDLPLAERVAAAAGLPVRLDNDANAVTLGEALWGAGRGAGDFVCLTLGSGIGGGLFLDGDVYRGTDGMAGELGHLTVEPEGFPCACGNRGCFEQYASAAGLRNFVRRDRLFGDMTEAALDDPDLPRRLYRAAMAGDARCQGYFDEFGYRMALGIAGILNVLDVRTVVLAGGLAHAFPAFSPRLLEQLPTRGYPAVVGGVNVVQCSLWEQGGVLGAAALVDGARGRKRSRTRRPA
jgi:glucokinase